MQTVAEDSGVTAMVLHERRQKQQADRQRDAVLAGVGLAGDAARRAVRGPVAWDNARLAELEEELCRRHEAEGGQPADGLRRCLISRT
jgi:hypothetical protein